MNGLLLLNDVVLADALEFAGSISVIARPEEVESICEGNAMVELHSREILIKKKSEAVDIVVQCMFMYWR